MELDELIKKHLNWHPTELQMASAKYFVESGKVSGGLFIAIKKIAEEAIEGYKAAQSKPAEKEFTPQIKDAIISYKCGNIPLEDLLKLIDPMPDELDYVTGAPDASGEIYDQFLSQEYNHDLNEWKKRQPKAAQSKPADQDSEAVWTKALNDAYDVWESKGKEGEFSLVVVNHLRANYSLYPVAAQSKGGWTDIELGEAFYAGVDFGKDPEEAYDFEDYLRLTKDYKTQEAIYKNYPNLNASKEEMDEMRKLK